MAGWKRGARQKPMPTSSMQRVTPAGPRSTATPSASKTSADPEIELDALPPCLHTRAPDAATITAAIVETLIDPLRSPPLPQVSTRPGPRSIRSPRARIACTSPIISWDVSPLVRSDAANAAICVGAASPARIESRAAPASSEVRSSRRKRRPSTSGQPPSSEIVVVARPSAGSVTRVNPTTGDARGHLERSVPTGPVRCLRRW